MSTLNATTTGNEQLTADKVTAFADAKKRLAARIAQLLAFRARAQKSGNTKMVMTLDADLKEANSLKAKAAAADALLAPFLKAWEWAKKTIGLGDLGAIFIPVAVVGSIAAVIYGINVLDRKLETAADRYEAEITAVEAWKGKGLTTSAAQAQVNKTGGQISDENKNKPGLFGNMSGLVKFGTTLAVIGGGLWWWSKHSEQKNARN